MARTPAEAHAEIARLYHNGGSPAMSAEQMAVYAEGKRTADSLHSTIALDRGIDYSALTPEQYEAQCATFERQMTTLIPDPAARAVAVARYRESNRQYVREG